MKEVGVAYAFDDGDRNHNKEDDDDQEENDRRGNRTGFKWARYSRWNKVSFNFPTLVRAQSIFTPFVTRCDMMCFCGCSASLRTYYRQPTDANERLMLSMTPNAIRSICYMLRLSLLNRRKGVVAAGIAWCNVGHRTRRGDTHHRTLDFDEGTFAFSCCIACDAETSAAHHA